MTDDRIPADVAQLLRDHVQTYEELEMLLAIARDPEREHSIATLLVTLNLEASAGAGVVEELAKAGVVTITRDAAGGRVRCDPGAAGVVAGLAEAYDTARVELMSRMTQNALERVRTSALRTFSSAFVLGKKRDG